MWKKNKFIPKIKKSLKWFLTDESWKITKKDALGITLWVGVLSWVDIDLVSANHSSWAQHSSATTCSGHANQASFSWYNSGSHQSWYLRWGHSSWDTSGHWSRTVSWWNPSWHYSNQVRAQTSPSGHLSWYEHGWHSSGTSRWTEKSQWHFNKVWHQNHWSSTGHWSHWSHWSHCSSMC